MYKFSPGFLLPISFSFLDKLNTAVFILQNFIYMCTLTLLGSGLLENAITDRC
jgi:hypothetical protein